MSAIARPQARWTELLLLLLAAGVTLVAATPAPIAMRGAVARPDLVPALTLVALWFVAHATLVLWGRGADQVLLPIVACLMGLGLALIQRLAPAFGARQWLWLLLGVVTIIAAVHASVGLRELRRYRYTWALLGIGLVAVTLIAGHSAAAGGPRLWLGVGILSFQPAEVLKFLLVVFLAGYLEDKRELISDASTRIGRLRLPPVPYFLPLAVMLGLSLALLAVQGDLGAALLLFAISLGMLFLASGSLRYVVVGLTLFVAGAYVMLQNLAIVQTRAAIWLDPWSDASGAGYQLVQSLMALGAGGVIGTGLGAGLPTTVPAVHTDFVFSAVVEEIGLAGGVAVLALYLLFTVRGFRVAIQAVDPFARFLAAGLTFALAVQTFIILGGVVKLIPLTGITLPFISVGGSSMLISAVSAGLLLRISRTTAANASGLRR